MPNNAYNLLKLIRNATYSYLRANSIDKKIISTLGVAEGSIVALAIVNSAGNVMISGDQFATFGASTTALTGALIVGDTTTPSITTLSGKTNTGFLSILGKTSGGLKLIPADTSGYLITVTNTAQTVGTVSLTIPDFAGVADTFVFTTIAQTLAGKTLAFVRVSTQALSGAGAVNVTTGTTKLTTTGASQALSLADGVDGQIKYIVHDVDGGSAILTPTTKLGYTTVTFTNAGDSATLQFATTRGWWIMSLNGAVAA